MFYDRRARRAARRGYRRGFGGGRGIFGFPWFLLVLLIIFSHTFWALVVGVVVAIVLTAILLRVFGSQDMMGGNYQQPPQQPYYQSPYQQSQDPYQQAYQPPQEPSYQPYDQGYQPPQPQETYQEGGQAHPYAKQNDPYQQYEQPQAQYPDQMPPMEQH
jgi:hypothetical protein